MGWRDRARPAGGATGGGSWRERARPTVVTDLPEDIVTEHDADALEQPGHELRSTVLDEMPIRGDVQGFAEPERPYGSGLTPRGRALARYELGEGPDPGPANVGRDYDGLAPAMGAVDAATFGFADEIGGALRAPFTDRSYREEQQALEREMDTAREENPWQFGLGGVGGGLLTAPVTPLAGAGAATRTARVGGAVASGVGYGAAQGAGHSRGDFGSGQFVEDTLAGGAIGGAGGGLIQGGSEAVGAGLRAAGRGMANAAARQRIAAAGGQVREQRAIAQHFPGGAEGFSRTLQETGISSPLATAEHMAERAAPVRERAGREIGEILEATAQAPAAGAGPMRTGAAPGRIDTSAFERRVYQDIVAPLQQSPVPQLRGAADEVLATLDNLAAQYPDGIDIHAAQQIKRDLDGVINYHARQANPGQDSMRRMRGMLREEMEGAVGRAGESIGDPAMAQRYEQARRAYGASEEVLDMADERAMRQNSNRALSLTDYISGAGGLAAGGIPGAIGTMAANRLLRSREHSIAATGADAIARLARSAPERLGPYATSITNALQRGPQAYAAAYFVMSQSDPQFRELTQQLESEGEEIE